MTAYDIPDDEAVLPPIVLAQSQRHSLLALAVDHLIRLPREAGALLQEVCRAEVRPDDEVTEHAARLGARVTFTVDGVSQTVLLVAHDDASSDPSHLSVLTNLGAGLLGLSPGQAIDWPDRVGGRRRLTVLSVDADRREESGGESPQTSPEPVSHPAVPADVIPFRRPTPAPLPNNDPPPSAA